MTDPMKRAAVMFLLALCELAACRGADRTPAPDAGPIFCATTFHHPCPDAATPPADGKADAP